MKKFRFFFMFSVAAAVFAFASGVNHSLETKKYVGAKVCGECHKKEYALWTAGPHAKAYDRLNADQKNDLTCLWCHATDARENFRSFKMAGVQCEACHGSGAQYSSGSMAENFAETHKSGLKKIDETVCIDCHTRDRAPSILSFNYTKKLELIKHWKTK